MSKYLCDLHAYLGKRDALVVSVGSNGDFSFEQAIKRLAPHTTLHTIDGTLSKRKIQVAAANAHVTTMHYANLCSAGSRRDACLVGRMGGAMRGGTAKASLWLHLRRGGGGGVGICVVVCGCLGWC